MNAITIRLKESSKHKDVLEKPKGTLYASSRGNLIRILDYWERTDDKPDYYVVLILNTNTIEQPFASDFLKGIETGALKEVEVC